MAYQLIPFPISIILMLVFVVAIMFVLWKIRGNGKIYRYLFYLCTALAILLLVGVIYTLATAAQPF